MLLIRSSLYWLVFASSTIILGIGVLLCFMFPFRVRYAFLKAWSIINLTALKYICNLDYRIEGLENIPAKPSIIFAKHQSTYETMVLTWILQPIVSVVKRELLWIPFFGWGFALANPIAIDRKSGLRAMKQIASIGTQRLKAGYSVLIFPEGTRKLPGESPSYLPGGAMLAAKSQYPILPIAHNAGKYWPRQSFIKHPGTVVFSIGALINTTGKDAKIINQEAQNWIEHKMDKIS